MPIAAISIEEFEQRLRAQPGLLLGPGTTLGQGCLIQIAHDLSRGHGGPDDRDPFLVADKLIGKGVGRTQLLKTVRDSVQCAQGRGDIGRLTTIRWGAVASFSLDNAFELSSQAWADKSPLRPTITAIVGATETVPPRTLPVFKMLGSCLRDDFVLTTNDYRRKKTEWMHAIQSFSTLVRGNPVICSGFAECEPMLLDFIATLIGAPVPLPGPLVFAASDPVVSLPGFMDLVADKIRVLTLAAPLEDAITAIGRSAKSGYTSMLSLEAKQGTPFEALRAFADVAVTVNLHTTTELRPNDTSILKDLLFSPTNPRWDPFAYDLDFKRTVSSILLDRIKEAATRDELVQVLVHGASAVGKTTILKRVAFSLASSGYPVIWFLPYFFQDGPTEMRRLLDAVKEECSPTHVPVVFFIDDPLGLGSVRANDIVTAARTKAIRAVFVTATRTAEADDGDSTVSNSCDRVVDCQVPDVFDSEEQKRLPQYLVDLGICSALAESKSRVDVAGGRSAKDVLAMLFTLLPETRHQITASVREELLRLGDRSAFIRIVIGQMEATSDLVRQAYELVAVAEKYGTGVPIEVLVSALQVPYEDWLSVSSNRGSIWGLLYQETPPDAQTILYRTRNEIVAGIIVDVINGGALSKGGELLRLRRLFQACKGSTPAYREFCIRVLVPNNRGRLDALSYEEGLLLFEDAISALPIEDRTLLHHLGRWEKNKGDDPSAARRTLLRALRAPDYPYSSRGELDGHIHTTLAATELDLLRKKAVSPEDAKRNVLRHLDRARAAQFADPMVTHVHANLIVKLADSTGSPLDSDNVTLIGTALADVDRTLLLLRSEFAPQNAQRRKNIDLLEDVRSQILNRCGEREAIQTAADDLWDKFRSQSGIVVRGRLLYGNAVAKNKGGDFRKACDYLQAARDRIRSAGGAISVELDEVLLHTYFYWRVQRHLLSEAAAPIDWTLICELASRVASDPLGALNPFYRYIVGLAKSHLCQWGEASACFDKLRAFGLTADVLWTDRNFLMGERGGMRRVQGVVRTGAAGRRFVKVDELGTDFLAERSERWGHDGEIVHVYVRFRFAGPVVVKEP